MTEKMKNMKMVKLGDVVNIKTGKLDANAADEDGKHPFFTCAIEPLRINTPAYNCECVLIAGNGDLNVKYFKGEFNAYQRTYIIESKDAEILDVRYLYHFMNQYIHELRKLSIGGVIKYIKLGNLTDPKIPLPPLPEQRRIAEILDWADAARRKRRENLTLYDDLIRSLFLKTFGDPVSNPKDMNTTSLEKVCIRVTDGTHQSPQWETSGVPFLFISNIVDSQIEFNTSKFISAKTHKELTRRCPIEVGDILYTTVGSYGNVAVVSTTRKFAFQRHIAHIKPDHDFVNSTFLAAMLQSPGVRRQVDRATRGVAQKTVNLADLKKLIIYDPPLFIQKEFAEKIQEINAQKTREQALYEQHDDLFNALLQRAFKGEL